MRGVAQVAAVAVLGAALSGCDLLTLLGGEDPFPFDPGNPFPSPVATYSAGTATIEMDGETVVLDRIVGTGSFDPDYGIDVKWTNGEGWYLSYYGLPDAGGPFAPEGYLSIDRVMDSRHWIVYNPERCITTTDEATADGLSGSAICRGLEWTDYFSAYTSTGFPVEIPGEPAFDADITFEAH
ncbi:MAG: hypothetical protein A2V84_12445 [Chloroflexi bacterium RBG_16_70_13]|nr:MAG: hypothetical protein A2V84_12445 [Chloroflexi bacterium RBG_16_70_13]